LGFEIWNFSNENEIGKNLLSFFVLNLFLKKMGGQATSVTTIPSLV
jgi:hypothetical protein